MFRISALNRLYAPTIAIAAAAAVSACGATAEEMEELEVIETAQSEEALRSSRKCNIRRVSPNNGVTSRSAPRFRIVTSGCKNIRVIFSKNPKFDRRHNRRPKYSPWKRVSRFWPITRWNPSTSKWNELKDWARPNGENRIYYKVQGYSRRGNNLTWGATRYIRY